MDPDQIRSVLLATVGYIVAGLIPTWIATKITKRRATHVLVFAASVGAVYAVNRFHDRIQRERLVSGTASAEDALRYVDSNMKGAESMSEEDRNFGAAVVKVSTENLPILATAQQAGIALQSAFEGAPSADIQVIDRRIAALRGYGRAALAAKNTLAAQDERFRRTLRELGVAPAAIDPLAKRFAES